MKRRRILLLGVLAVVAAGVWLGWPHGPADPVYRGKHLSQWLEEAVDHSDGQKRTNAQNAIKAIGTNALPYLMSEFSHTDGDGGRMRKVRYALYLLGPDVAPAVPALASHLSDSYRGMDAARGMCEAGEIALPYFIKAVSSTNLQTVNSALTGLGQLAETNELAVPPLIQLLNHTNNNVRSMAVIELARTGRRPDLTLPLLVEMLSDSISDMRGVSAGHLGRMGASAKPAITNLLALMADPDPLVASQASNAVFQIDPAALTPRRP